MKVRCDAYETCMRECFAKNTVDLNDILPGSEMYFFLSDPGSCYHDLHIDGKYREATIVEVE